VSQKNSLLTQYLTKTILEEITFTEDHSTDLWILLLGSSWQPGLYYLYLLYNIIMQLILPQGVEEIGHVDSVTLLWVLVYFLSCKASYRNNNEKMILIKSGFHICGFHICNLNQPRMENMQKKLHLYWTCADFPSLSLFPKQYNITTIHRAFTLYLAL
jgi:hypothetical protein